MSTAICNFFDAVKIVPIASYASANSDRNSEVIDCLDVEAVRIVVHHAVVHDSATYAITLAHADAASNETTLTSGADVLDSSQTVGTADDVARYIDFVPTKRYYQVTFNKDGSNACAESAIAYLRMKTRPVTHAGGTSAIGDGTAAVVGEFLGAAVSGTA
jgi:hypothetical protein